MDKVFKILLVEDDKMISSMYETKLKQDNYIVYAAEDGARALEIASQEKPDLILLDIILPQLDGFFVLQELKNNESTKNIPVVMLTNLGTSEDKEKGKQLHADAYLVKANLTPSQLCEEIKQYLK
jgi:DNA-binding response OmpR family regulator